MQCAIKCYLTLPSSSLPSSSSSIVIRVRLTSSRSRSLFALLLKELAAFTCEVAGGESGRTVLRLGADQNNHSNYNQIYM